jgi:hypothetical protein
MSTDTTETPQTQPDESSQAPALPTSTPPKRRKRTVTTPADLMVVEQPQPTVDTPTGLLKIAVEQNFDIEKLERLMQLQREWDADQSRKAFFAALSKFQSEIPPITKSDRIDAGRAGKRKFATLGTINEAIRPYLYANGLSFRFGQTQSPQGITVACIVSHCDGHSEVTSLTAGADMSQGKNPIQSIGSTITYLERYTLVGALGLTTVDEDDDGGSQSDPEQAQELTPEQRRQRAMEIAQAAAGVGQQPTPAPAATATPTPPPAVTSSSPAPASGITQQQLTEMMGLMRKLFASGAAAGQWLFQLVGSNDPTSLSQPAAIDALIVLNRMAAEASMAAMPAAPGPDAGNARVAESPQQPQVQQPQVQQPLTPPPTAPATPEQRLAIRDLTVRAYTAQAPQRQADWLQMLGHTSADQITAQQAEERTEYLRTILGDIPF